MHEASFEPILHLLLESPANAILMQTLAKRWWDTTHTFYITKREMIVTPYNFHQITGLRYDEALIDLDGELGIQLSIELPGQRHMIKTVLEVSSFFLFFCSFLQTYTLYLCKLYSSICHLGLQNYTLCFCKLCSCFYLANYHLANCHLANCILSILQTVTYILVNCAFFC